MALIDADILRENFDVVSNVKDERINFCISQASRQLKTWVGAENYGSTDVDIKAALTDAESNLTIYYVLLNTAVRIRRDGIVKKEQDGASPMTANAVINEYLTPKEVKELRDEFFQTALDLAAPFRVVQTSSRNASVLMRGGWANDCE